MPLKYIKKNFTELKGQIDFDYKVKLCLGGFNTPFSI